MSLYFRLILCFACHITTASAIASPQYYLSISMIFRDEAEYLQEWIEFHRLIGVDHFYLYNNLSQDNYLEVLTPYINQNIVELTEWSQISQSETEWNTIQIAAYNNALEKARSQSKWLAILDSDEFLVPIKDNTLPSFLKRYEKQKDLGGLLVSWVIFGTSHVAKIPKDKLLIETLVLCNYGAGAAHFKSVVMPKRVAYVNTPHHVIYKKGYTHQSTSGQLPPFFEYDKIRINHYWSRDEWYLHNVKIARRGLWGTEAETVLNWAAAGNACYDDSMQRYVAPLRKRMHKP